MSSGRALGYVLPVVMVLILVAVLVRRSRRAPATSVTRETPPATGPRRGATCTDPSEPIEDAPQERQLRLSSRQRASIGLLSLQGQTCTATLIGARTVVTAAHCLPDAPQCAWFIVVQGSGLTRAFRIVRASPHAVSDITLGELDRVVDAEPIEMADEHLSNSNLQDPLVSVGFGVDRVKRSHHRRHFLLSLESYSDTELRTRALGRGPCLGDSGAPLLRRGRDGRVRLFGVLARGSGSCTGTDTFVRTDTTKLEAWAHPAVHKVSSHCGSVDRAGFCSGTRAVFCDSRGTLSVDNCPGTERCGWVTGVGYRCTAVSTDACRGVPPFGRCVDGVLETCRSGKLYTEVCSRSGRECLVNDETLEFGCSERIWNACIPELVEATPGTRCAGSWFCRFDAAGCAVKASCEQSTLFVSRQCLQR